MAKKSGAESEVSEVNCEGPVVSNEVPVDSETVTSVSATRQRRRNAGNRLQTILEEERKDIGDSQVSEAPQPARGVELSEVCCRCNNLTTSNDVVVHCQSTHCGMVAHYDCAGYRSKSGARRAKFQCDSCKRSKSSKPASASTLSQTGGKAPSASPCGNGTEASPVATAESLPSNGAQSCLCTEGNSCSVCELPMRVAQEVESIKRENREMKLHILSLEERVAQLESELRRVRTASTNSGRRAVNEASVRPKSSLSNQSYSKSTSAKANTHKNKSRVFCRSYASVTASGHTDDNPHNTRLHTSAGPKRQRTPTGQDTTNFRVIWGTRFNTTTTTVKNALLQSLSLEEGGSITVTKSFRRNQDRTKWWFTVMASPVILATLDSSWLSASMGKWRLQTSLRPPGLTQNVSTANNSPGPSPCEVDEQQSKEVVFSDSHDDDQVPCPSANVGAKDSVAAMCDLASNNDSLAAGSSPHVATQDEQAVSTHDNVSSRTDSGLTTTATELPNHG